VFGDFHNNYHTVIIDGLYGGVPLFDFICNRSLNFVRKRLSCDNILVNFVAQPGVLFLRKIYRYHCNDSYGDVRFSNSSD